MTSPDPLQFPAAVVAARGLSQRVATGEGTLDILTDVSLAVKAGETLAIVGASGSGKSTLLGLLAGLDHASGGEVWLLGERLNDLDEDARARLRAGRIGFVFQSFQLLPALTALENILLPLELSAAPDARERAAHWLEQVGLGARASHYPRQLSGGEQQRVAIARALANAPRLLLADEPTGNLDPANAAKVLALLAERIREAGAIGILVTHSREAAATTDRVLHLTETGLHG